MKNMILRFVACGVVACVVGAFAPVVSAASAPAAELLRQAYTALDKADHDYDGHRIEAMKRIEAAGKELGENIRGDGKGHEKQGVSDKRLRTADALLKQAIADLKGKALKHVKEARKELAVALKTK